MTRLRQQPYRVAVTLPRWMRPKLQRGNVLALDLAHHLNLHDIASGQADETMLWHWVEAAFTWSKVAELTREGELEMAEQLDLATRMVLHYGATGRVEFPTAADLELARDGVSVMGQLAQRTDRASALAAADWSEAHMQRLRAQAQAAGSAA